MTARESKLSVAEQTNVDTPADTPIKVAMVYKNDLNEISYISDTGAQSATESGSASIVLVFVLTLLALVTVSRRPVV